MTGSELSRREFVGLAAGAASAISLSGCAGLGRARNRLVAVAAAPLLSPDRGSDAFGRAAASFQAAGVDLAVVPVAREPADASSALRNLLGLHRHAARLPERVRIVSEPAHLDANPEGALGLLPQISGVGTLPDGTPEELLAFTEGLRGLGVRVVQPVHAWKNRLGDGCYERTDKRLTETGRRAIRALSEAGVLIDLSGMGRQSSLDALALASGPVVFSRSNAAGVHDHRGNLTDEQIDACAKGGGVIGISAFPALVSGSASPDLAEVVRHVEYVAERVGAEHVALGLDFDDRERKRFPSDPVPAPPYRYPSGIARIEELSGLRSALESRGFGSREITQILGGNFVRVLLAAWEEEK